MSPIPKPIEITTEPLKNTAGATQEGDPCPPTDKSTGPPTFRFVILNALKLTSFSSVWSVLVGVAGTLFGLYQWSITGHDDATKLQLMVLEHERKIEIFSRDHDLITRMDEKLDLLVNNQIGRNDAHRPSKVEQILNWPSLHPTLIKNENKRNYSPGHGPIVDSALAAKRRF